MIHEEIFKSKFAQGTLIWFMDFMSELDTNHSKKILEALGEL